MRTIKFRGIIKNPDELFDGWVYGDLIHYANGAVAIRQQETGQEFETIPESVGQFTGLFDKNGKEIFEHDVVNIDKVERKYIVKFHNGCFKLFHADPKLNGMLWGTLERVSELNFTTEVISNLIENPEY